MTTSPFKVLIPTSGVGVPLGELINYTNKTLIKIGKKPTLSYIIDSYPKNTEFVITLGHFSEHVKDFLKIAYPNHKITLVPVTKFSGPGSSIANSLLMAKKHLQCPFVYHASDTIVTDKIPAPKENWLAGYKGTISSNYASFDVIDSYIQTVHMKGMTNSDYLHIGLAGIKDHKHFWSELENLYNENPQNSELGDIHALDSMLKNNARFKVYEITNWYDVGTVDGLNVARNKIADSFHILDKPSESIYLYDKYVIKFFSDAKNVSQRVKRAKTLSGLVPPLMNSGEYFYQYKYVDGDLMADIARPENITNLLEWAKKKLWKPVEEVSNKEFTKICDDFYNIKTRKRLTDLFSSRGIIDKKEIINGVLVPKTSDILEKIDFKWLANAKQTGFHGDFILDNILKTAGGFCLLDWRQNFGGLLKAGDLYYDLSKMNHNLTINHGIINDNLFSIDVSKKEIRCEILRKESLVESQKAFNVFVIKNGYDIKKINILTPLIWLNMSPLHQHPFDLFLYYFGKYNLWKALQNEQQI
ncbi:MAG: hypothetical protein WCT36_01525 [Candidatus Gracilibacteria bacterium]|jgi:choline kinase